MKSAGKARSSERVYKKTEKVAFGGEEARFYFHLGDGISSNDDLVIEVPRKTFEAVPVGTLVDLHFVPVSV